MSLVKKTGNYENYIHQGIILYLYIFGDFYRKKMLDIDLQSWIYVFEECP